MSRSHTLRERSGFTLVELIVVIVLILFLAGLTARFLPSFSSQAREANTASLVQGWLNMAKQKALRDQASRGLRLWNKNGDLRIIECEFIELPDPYTGDPIFTFPVPPAAGSATPSAVVFQGITLANGFAQALQKDWLVQPGDYLSINGGQMRKITQLTLNAPKAGEVQATLNSPLPAPIQTDPNSGNGTSNYYIQRSPRPIGDETLQLPVDDPNPPTLRAVCIDLTTNIAYGPYNNIPGVTGATAATMPYVDILFSPTGAAMVFVASYLPSPPNAANVLSVTPVAVPTGILNLWVRMVDPAANPSNSYFYGDPSLVSIHLANGFVGAYTPDPQLPANNPYTYVQ